MNPILYIIRDLDLVGIRKYSSRKPLPEDGCPVCGEDMTKCHYAGKKHICKDIGEVGYKPWFVDDELDEKGEPNYPDGSS